MTVLLVLCQAAKYVTTASTKYLVFNNYYRLLIDLFDCNAVITSANKSGTETRIYNSGSRPAGNYPSSGKIGFSKG